MVGDGACGVKTAHPGAWVAAVLIETCFVPRTLGIDDTLRLALNVRVADIVPDTATRGCPSLF